METTIITKGICLNFCDYKDYDRLVNIFSVDYGILTAKIKGIKKSSAKLKMASETFCLAEYTLLRRDNYYIIIGANIIDSFFDIVKNYELFSLSNGLLEATIKSLPERTPQSIVFINLLKSLKAICYEKKHPIYVVCHYIGYLLNYLGYKINFYRCANCQKELEDKIYFDFDLGSFVCGDCNEYGKRVDRDFLKFLKLVVETPIAESDNVNFKELNLKPVLNFLMQDLEKRLDKSILSIKNYLNFMTEFR